MQQLILTGPDKKIELLYKEFNLKLRRWGIEVEWHSLAPPTDAIEGPEQVADPEQGIAPGATENNDSGSETNEDAVKTDVKQGWEAKSIATADETAKIEAEKASVNVTGKPPRTTKQEKEADHLKQK